jgi:hypothetical protein
MVRSKFDLRTLGTGFDRWRKPDVFNARAVPSLPDERPRHAKCDSDHRL